MARTGISIDVILCVLLGYLMVGKLVIYWEEGVCLDACDLGWTSRVGSIHERKPGCYRDTSGWETTRFFSTECLFAMSVCMYIECRSVSTYI